MIMTASESDHGFVVLYVVVSDDHVASNSCSVWIVPGTIR